MVESKENEYGLLKTLYDAFPKRGISWRFREKCLPSVIFCYKKGKSVKEASRICKVSKRYIRRLYNRIEKLEEKLES